jgi:hypothetical protein
MAIVNALAGIMVSELTTAEAWYELLLSRPADARPMEGLAEWKLADADGFKCFKTQSVQDRPRSHSWCPVWMINWPN